MRRHRVRVAVVLAALAGTLLVTGVAAPSSTPPPLPVTGYAVDSTSLAVLDAQAPAITTVSVAGVVVAASGDDVSAPSGGAFALLAEAHARGLRAVLLVSNFTNGATPTDVARRLLRSAANRAIVVRKLVAYVRNDHWDGVTVDLESLDPGDAAGLVAVVAALHRALPRQQVAVDVSATTTVAEYEAGGYHLPALAASAQVVLMAYDEHGPWGAPGPIGGLPWQRASIHAALSVMSHRRLTLGVAAYGFTWPAGAALHDGSAVSVLGARRLAAQSGRLPRWVASAGEYTVTLRDGTTLWWADSRSFSVRVRLAEGLSLGGLAVWQLATADRLPART